MLCFITLLCCINSECLCSSVHYSLFFKLVVRSVDKYLINLRVRRLDAEVTVSLYQVVSSIHLDWMEQPPASLVIQGLLRPTVAGESLITRKPSSSG